MNTAAHLRLQLPAQREANGPQYITQAAVPALRLLRARLLAHALLLLGSHGQQVPPSPFDLVRGAVNKGGVARSRARTGRCKVVRLVTRAVYHCWRLNTVTCYLTRAQACFRVDL